MLNIHTTFFRNLIATRNVYKIGKILNVEATTAELYKLYAMEKIL